MPQTARPVAPDDFNIGWLSSPVFSKINGSPGAGGVTAPAGQSCAFKVKLAGMAWPQPLTPQILSVGLSCAGTAIVTVILLQGNAPVAGWTVTVSGTGTFNLTLTDEQIALITNYNDLHVMVATGTPVVSGCAACTKAAALMFTFPIPGITGPDSCQVHNYTHYLFRVGTTGCSWSDFDARGLGQWIFTYSSPPNEWQLQHVGSIPPDIDTFLYTATGAGWDCQSPLTLTKQTDLGPCTLPDTITVTPFPSNPVPNNDVICTSVQMQIPNPAPGVPTNPSNPCFGQKILPPPPAGCGCACGGGCTGNVSACNCSCQPANCPPPSVTGACVSCNPVRYATGEIQVIASDLEAEGFGLPWGHTRSFTNQLTQSTLVGNGYNWQIREWPYLVIQDSGTVVLMGQGNAVLWFDPAGSGYVPRFSVRQTLIYNSGNNVFQLVDLDGSIFEFSGTSGAFIQHTDAAGNSVAVVSYASNNFNFT